MIVYQILGTLALLPLTLVISIGFFTSIYRMLSKSSDVDDVVLMIGLGLVTPFFFILIALIWEVGL